MLLRSLGVLGWDALEPAVLAALATESPILLIGPHGSAKTLLLVRLAEALGLAHRHYNASILNFDDLLGYPVPQDGRLVYLQTPATIWDAEAVLFDEVSRCRPELQNKLFPLVHERVVQGMPLPRLRHRWAAMNPPPSADGSGGDTAYVGAEPLDVALADRFAFVLEAPAFADLSDADQAAVLAGGGAPASDGPECLRAALERCRARLEAVANELRPHAADYARVLAHKLASAGHPLSTRRAVTVARNIEALRAAHLALGTGVLEDAFYDAARFSLPDAAWGCRPEGQLLVAAHRAAWEAAGLAPGSPARALLTETDPVRLIALALTSPLDPAEAGTVIADAFASLARSARLVTAAVLFPRLTRRPDLPASAIETVAEAYAAVVRGGSERVAVRRGGQDWKRQILGTRLAELDPSTDRDRVIHNAAATLMAEETRFEIDDLGRAFDHARDVLAGAGEAAA